jgi:hypothetical protein
MEAPKYSCLSCLLPCLAVVENKLASNRLHSRLILTISSTNFLRIGGIIITTGHMITVCRRLVVKVESRQ